MSLSPKRKGRLTASVFAAAMGLNPYQSKQALYRQLVGIDEPFTGNEATEWGNENEQNAVDAYEAEMGLILTSTGDNQKFVIHPEHDWLGCTPDGFGDNHIAEIKCPYSMELYKDVPGYYMPQIQGQLFITAAAWCHFVCWTPDELAVWRVEPNEEYQEQMLRYLRKFYDYWQAGEEPKRSKKPVMPSVTKERII